MAWFGRLMASLVVALGEGKGTWAQVSLLANGEWDFVYFVTTPFFKGKFSCERPSEEVVIDDQLDVQEMVSLIVDRLGSKLSEKVGLDDVGLNFVSGSGKLHMAILAALMKCGVGIRLVAMNSSGLVTI